MTVKNGRLFRGGGTMGKTRFRKVVAVAFLAGAPIAAASPAFAGTATRAPFGALPDGRAVEAVTLDNGHGLRARILSYGAILQSLDVPDRQGRSADIVLGYADAATYLTRPNYF